MEKAKDAIALSFSREFAREHGITEALIYKEIYRSYFFWKNHGKLQNGMYWCDQKVMADWLLISVSTLGRAIKKLKDKNLIDYETHYRPGTQTTTTWWKIIEKDDDEKERNSTSGQNDDSHTSGQNDDSHIKPDKEPDTTEGDADEEIRMLPATLYSKLRLFFPGSPNDMRQKKVDAVGKLQKEYELSDDTILDGIKAISEHPTYKFKDGREYTETLTSLLLGDLDKTAKKIMRKVEEKKVKDSQYRMINGVKCKKIRYKDANGVELEGWRQVGDPGGCY